MKPLPIRIMQMITKLHQRGYSSIYLYSGMSPGGMHWRYEIGQVVFGQWPTKPAWVSSSVQSEGSTIWTADNSTVAAMTDGFQQYFKGRLIQDYKPSDYSQWYAAVLAELKAEEPLKFFGDYAGKHQHLLATAPGYKKQ